MTPEQIRLAKALASAGLFPGSNAKRFARDMASRASLPEPAPLTPAQHRYLCDLVHRHRRTIADREAVALAQALAIQGPPAPPVTAAQP